MKWIKCSVNQMPEPNEVLRFVTIKTQDRKPFVCLAGWAGKFWIGKDGDVLMYDNHEVTHYQEIPEPAPETITIKLHA